MSLVTCDGIHLASLQNVISASIGVAIAYPILAQIIEIRNEKVLKECRRVLTFTRRNHGDSGFSDLGNEQVQYQFGLHRIAKMNGTLTLFSTSIGFFAYINLTISSLGIVDCISEEIAYALCFLYSSPFILGVLQIQKWYDNYSRFNCAIAYYRGDFKKTKH
tara:strand:+ start:30 stop:515 length:486 start_codon:yes stop_codon:yes gene_type:complete